VPDFTTYQKALLHMIALLGLAITAVAALLFIIALWDIFGEMHWGNTWGVDSPHDLDGRGTGNQNGREEGAEMLGLSDASIVHPSSEPYRFSAAPR
jgi:hypothetical protein